LERARGAALGENFNICPLSCGTPFGCPPFAFPPSALIHTPTEGLQIAYSRKKNAEDNALASDNTAQMARDDETYEDGNRRSPATRDVIPRLKTKAPPEIKKIHNKDIHSLEV